jgi:hypothetical protein
MNMIARTRPGFQLKRHHDDRGWAASFALAEPRSLSLQQTTSESSLYLVLHDSEGAMLEERWHSTLEEAMEAASREFALSMRDWVFVPQWRSRLSRR